MVSRGFGRSLHYASGLNVATPRSFLTYPTLLSTHLYLPLCHAAALIQHRTCDARTLPAIALGTRCSHTTIVVVVLIERREC